MQEKRQKTFDFLHFYPISQHSEHFFVWNLSLNPQNQVL